LLGSRIHGEAHSVSGRGHMQEFAVVVFVMPARRENRR